MQSSCLAGSMHASLVHLRNVWELAKYWTCCNKVEGNLDVPKLIVNLRTSNDVALKLFSKMYTPAAHQEAWCK